VTVLHADAELERTRAVTEVDRVSIIVPVYNEIRTIRAVIDRLLTIDLPVEREILIVDDGSTDGTREVLARAEADGIRATILLAERNGGKGSAIRRGLALAEALAMPYDQVVALDALADPRARNLRERFGIA